jgi:hypothetical protein
MTCNRWTVHCGLLLACFALVSDIEAASQELTCATPSTARGFFFELSIPGASEVTPQGINDRGDIVGSYRDAQGVHGFLFRNGLFSTIDPVPGLGSSFATDINKSRTIIGNVADRGYILRRGAVTFVDAPGAFHTEVLSIDDAGIVVGFGMEPHDSRPDGIEFGFVRTPDGAFEHIRFPGTGTIVKHINKRGTLLVNVIGAQLLRVDGEYQVITPCRAIEIVVAITDKEHLVGVAVDPALGGTVGFVRSPRHYAIYRYPGAAHTSLRDMNKFGVAVGEANLPGRGQIGFVFVPARGSSTKGK